MVSATCSSPVMRYLNSRRQNLAPVWGLNFGISNSGNVTGDILRWAKVQFASIFTYRKPNLNFSNKGFTFLNKTCLSLLQTSTVWKLPYSHSEYSRAWFAFGSVNLRQIKAKQCGKPYTNACSGIVLNISEIKCYNLLLFSITGECWIQRKKNLIWNQKLRWCPRNVKTCIYSLAQQPLYQKRVDKDLMAKS